MHVSELEIVLADGQVVKVGPGHDTLPQQRDLVEELTCIQCAANRRAVSAGLLKRWPGYALARAAREPENLLHILCRQRRHAGGHCLRRIENRSAAGGTRRGLAVLCVRGRGDAGDGSDCSI